MLKVSSVSTTVESRRVLRPLDPTTPTSPRETERPQYRQSCRRVPAGFAVAFTYIDAHLLRESGPMVHVTGDRSSHGNSFRVPAQATSGHDDIPGDKNDKNSETAPPRSLLGSGVPRIVILDENAVYDHYMRRLSKVWMRRIKVNASNLQQFTARRLLHAVYCTQFLISQYSCPSVHLPTHACGSAQLYPALAVARLHLNIAVLSNICRTTWCTGAGGGAYLRVPSALAAYLYYCSSLEGKKLQIEAEFKHAQMKATVKAETQLVTSLFSGMSRPVKSKRVPIQDCSLAILVSDELSGRHRS